MLCPNCNLLCPPESLNCGCGYNFVLRGIPEVFVTAHYRDDLASLQRRSYYIRSIGAALVYLGARALLFFYEGLHERDFGLLVSGVYLAFIPLVSAATYGAALFLGKRISDPAKGWIVVVALGLAATVISRLTLG
jgi:hypothetical protein